MELVVWEASIAFRVGKLHLLFLEMIQIGSRRQKANACRQMHVASLKVFRLACSSSQEGSPLGETANLTNGKYCKLLVSMYSRHNKPNALHVSKRLRTKWP